MHDDADDPAGDDSEDDDAVPGGAVTPVWPPADATLARLEDWLETIRRLPADDFIFPREGALENRIAELRRPKPKGRASPFALVLRAKQATEKRCRQLQRFVAMRDGLLAEEEALKLTIADANATIEAMERLLKMAGETGYKRFCEYSVSQNRMPPDASRRRMPPTLPAWKLPAGTVATPMLLPGLTASSRSSSCCPLPRSPPT